METFDPDAGDRPDRAPRASPAPAARRRSCRACSRRRTSRREKLRTRAHLRLGRRRRLARADARAAREVRHLRLPLLRHDRVPDVHLRPARRSRGEAARHRRPAGAGRRRAPGRRARPAGRRPASRARSRPTDRSSASAISTRRSTRRSPPTASSAPATSPSLDAEGFVRITGRRKDIIIRKGENLSAKGIEDELAAHPAGRRRGGDRRARPAERRARLRLRRAATRRRRAHASPSVRTLHGGPRRDARRRSPSSSSCVDELPRNATGKVRKDQLRARFRSR